MSIGDIRRQLAGAWIPCPKVATHHQGLEAEKWCEACIRIGPQPGRLYFFTWGHGIRPACLGCLNCTDHVMWTSPTTYKRYHCQGQGWVASDNGWAWWRAVTQTSITKEHLDKLELAMYDDDPGAAFYAALCPAVEDNGGTLGV